ncbi:MAG: hypothetical protein AAB601_02185 [Patescibacteria group bacterium]
MITVTPGSRTFFENDGLIWQDPQTASFVTITLDAHDFRFSLSVTVEVVYPKEGSGDLMMYLAGTDWFWATLALERRGENVHTVIHGGASWESLIEWVRERETEVLAHARLTVDERAALDTSRLIGKVLYRIGDELSRFDETIEKEFNERLALVKPIK